MAVTFSPVVLPHLKKEDGTNFIRIRITHKRKSKYIKTAISVVPEDLKRSGALRHQGKLDLANEENEEDNRRDSDLHACGHDR